MKESHSYTKVPILDEETILGHKIVHKDRDPSTFNFIPIGDRCPLVEYISMDHQCCHEATNVNGQFV